MGKFKEFCKKHEQKLVFGGTLVAGIIIGAAVGEKLRGKDFVNLAGKDFISWTPTKNFMTLERVKESMDSLAGTGQSYAIVRDTLEGTDSYIGIFLNTRLKG